jgi:hypothetical protein
MWNRSKKFEGYWWLASNSERQWFGRLRWRAAESPKLSLQYRTIDEATASPPLQAESVLGLDKAGTPVSVLRIGCSGGLRSGFLSDRRYTAGHILKGVHVTTRDGFRAHRFELRLQYLGDWLREEGFEDPGSKNDEIAIRYSRPPDRSFEVATGVTVHVCHAARSVTRARQRKVGYDIFFAMEKKRSFSWKQASRFIDGLKGLLHFACLKPVKATGLSFENLDHTFELAGNRYPKQIKVFNASIAAPLKEYVHENNFVFTFQDVEAGFGAFCADWFEFCVEQKEALGCYYPTVYFTLPDQLRLISITQALEAYHQRFYRPKGDVKFQDRINELCRIKRQLVEKLVGDIEKFAAIVTDSRDYYTHHHPSIRAKGNVATGIKLTMMSYHLQYVFRLCILSRFGLERDRFDVLLRQIPDRVVEY